MTQEDTIQVKPRVIAPLRKKLERIGRLKLELILSDSSEKEFRNISKNIPLTP